MLLDLTAFILQKRPEVELHVVVAISQAWYNNWDPMAAKPPKALQIALSNDKRIDPLLLMIIQF